MGFVGHQCGRINNILRPETIHLASYSYVTVLLFISQSAYLSKILYFLIEVGNSSVHQKSNFNMYWFLRLITTQPLMEMNFNLNDEEMIEFATFKNQRWKLQLLGCVFEAIKSLMFFSHKIFKPNRPLLLRGLPLSVIIYHYVRCLSF